MDASIMSSALAGVSTALEDDSQCRSIGRDGSRHVGRCERAVETMLCGVPLRPAVVATDRQVRRVEWLESTLHLRSLKRMQCRRTPTGAIPRRRPLGGVKGTHSRVPRSTLTRRIDLELRTPVDPVAASSLIWCLRRCPQESQMMSPSRSAIASAQ